MNLAAVIKAFDTFMAVRAAAQRLRGEPPPEETTAVSQPSAAPGGQVEARLTNVVVAALKEAFDRDHARLELERAQLDEQRRRAEEAMRLELRRQAMERELGRLRMLSATALIGWIASVLTLVLRLPEASMASRMVVAAGWMLLLAALAAALTAQGRVGRSVPDAERGAGVDGMAAAAVWLLTGGLAVSAISLLV
jgi:hypothetical protein